MFTDRFIRNLKPQEKVKDIREKRGFGVRVKPDAAKIFFYRFKSPVTGARRFLSLGDYPTTTLEEARSEYNRLYDAVKAGIDPLEEKRLEEEARINAPTVADLCKEYIEKHAKRFKKSWAKDEAILNRDVVPLWGKRKAEDVTKRDVIFLLEKIIDRGSPGMANNCFQIVRKMFNFALERDILPHTPCAGVKLPAPKVSRDRVLSEGEIKKLWANLDKAVSMDEKRPSISDETQRAIKLILVTAQRPGEVIGMHTSEIDGRWWTIPADRAKNGKAHRVYLTDLALELVGDTSGKEYVFHCPHKDKNKPIGGNAMIVAIRRNLDKLETEYFTPHDLRRTAATFMAEGGAMDEVIDAILNHAKQGIIRVYNQYRYDREKQLVLESWQRKLRSLTTGTDAVQIIPMKRKIA